MEKLSRPFVYYCFGDQNHTLYEIDFFKMGSTCLWGHPTCFWGPPSCLWGPPSCLWDPAANKALSAASEIPFESLPPFGKGHQPLRGYCQTNVRFNINKTRGNCWSCNAFATVIQWWGFCQKARLETIRVSDTLGLLLWRTYFTVGQSRAATPNRIISRRTQEDSRPTVSSNLGGRDLRVVGRGDGQAEVQTEVQMYGFTNRNSPLILAGYIPLLLVLLVLAKFTHL